MHHLPEFRDVARILSNQAVAQFVLNDLRG